MREKKGKRQRKRKKDRGKFEREAE